MTAGMKEIPEEEENPFVRGFRMTRYKKSLKVVVETVAADGSGEYDFFQSDYDRNEEAFEFYAKLMTELPGMEGVRSEDDHFVIWTYTKTSDHAMDATEKGKSMDEIMKDVRAELPAVESPKTMDEVRLTPLLDPVSEEE
jgi:hypothetical protein